MEFWARAIEVTLPKACQTRIAREIISRTVFRHPDVSTRPLKSGKFALQFPSWPKRAAIHTRRREAHPDTPGGYRLHCGGRTGWRSTSPGTRLDEPTAACAPMPVGARMPSPETIVAGAGGSVQRESESVDLTAAPMRPSPRPATENAAQDPFQDTGELWLRGSPESTARPSAGREVFQ